MTYDNDLAKLRERLAIVRDIHAANGVLYWDHQTYMPKGAVAGRAEQMATLSRLAHQIFTDDETGLLLDRAAENGFDPETDDGAMVRVARRAFDRATKLPPELVQELTRTTALAEPAWVEARAQSNWNTLAPHLEKIVGLQRQVAEKLGYRLHPYDALLDQYEPSLTKAQVEAMFEELKTGIVPMVKEIAAQATEDRAGPLRGSFDEAKQEQFGKNIITRFGYDWERGRQDRTVHPFCINFGSNDVRITTRGSGSY